MTNILVINSIAVMLSVAHSIANVSLITASSFKLKSYSCILLNFYRRQCVRAVNAVLLFDDPSSGNPSE